MPQRSVRIPTNLDKKIEELVDVDKLYSSKADFVLSSMRYTLILYAQKKKEIAEKYPGVPLSEQLVNMTYSGITSVFLTAYNMYEGEPVQINVRVPDGLENRISQLMLMNYGFNKRADFIKVSIMCMLSTIREIDDIFDDIEKMRVDQETLREKIYEEVIKGLSQKKSGPDIIQDTIDKLLKNKDVKL